MEAYTAGISTLKVDALVEALGGSNAISKSVPVQRAGHLMEPIGAAEPLTAP